MLTLNQTIEILKNFSLKHKSLNSFYFGDKWEVGASNDIQYPLLWCSLTNTINTNGVIERKFVIDISDKVNLDESNETHVLSDCELIAFDLLNYLEQIEDLGEVPSFRVTKDSTLTDYTEDRDDMVTGWFFELSIKSHIGNYSCNLPINNGNIFDDNYIYIGGSTTSCGSFIVEIKDQDGNVIQTFNTSGEYVVTVLSGIKDTITSNVTTITDDII